MEGRTPVKIRILNAEPEGYSEEARAILTQIGELVEEPVPQQRLSERIRGFDVLIVRLGLRVTRDVLEAADRLQVIVTATTGLDHIDLKAAAEQGVTILSLQGETEFLRTISATAEHTWALLLALIRRVPWAFKSVCQGEWDRDRFRGWELAGRQLGILGLGRIGEKVARYGLAFGMKVGAYDPYRREWVKGIKRFKTIDSLLRWSEVLSVHLPLTDETRGLLNKERLALLPQGAIIVNTSRGAVIDEEALVTLLETKHLSGAAVDVVIDEQIPEQRMRSPLLCYAKEHDNLLITPHLGGATWESMRRTEVYMAKKLQQFLKSKLGEKMRW